MYFIVDMTWEIIVLKILIDFGTFSLVRLFRNLTPPSGGCGPLVALSLDRIKSYGFWAASLY